MEKESREILLRFLVSQKECEKIQERMKTARIKNFSFFARKMLLHGIIIVPDWEELKEIHRQLSGIGNNINQIARITNATHSVYKEDVDNLTHQMGEIRHMFFQLIQLMEQIENFEK